MLARDPRASSATGVACACNPCACNPRVRDASGVTCARNPRVRDATGVDSADAVGVVSTGVHARVRDATGVVSTGVSAKVCGAAGVVSADVSAKVCGATSVVSADVSTRVCGGVGTGVDAKVCAHRGGQRNSVEIDLTCFSKMNRSIYSSSD